jgi:hypothetical protein
VWGSRRRDVESSHHRGYRDIVTLSASIAPWDASLGVEKPTASRWKLPPDRIPGDRPGVGFPSVGRSSHRGGYRDEAAPRA